VQLLKGETPKAEMTLYDTPSQLFTPAVVTAENLKAEIIDKNIIPAAQLCVDRYVEGCKKLGIQ
jgi:D-xylose transport system substrate-binding protein